MPTRKVQIDPRKLKPYRSRIEPTDPTEIKARNERRLALFDSWLECPIHDIIARDGDFAIAEGNERVAGALLRGVAEITVGLLPADTPDSVLDSYSVLTDVHKTKLKPFELATVLDRYLKSTGVKYAEAAAIFRIDGGYVTKLLSLFDCEDDVRRAAAEGKLGPGDWYAISKSPDQAATLTLKLGGATRDDLVKATRKKTANAVRVEKLKCPLPSGFTVQISGEGVSLEEAIEAMAEATKEMKKAAAKGITAKTFANAMKDMAAN